MSYISNNTRLASFTIAGIDYTNDLISWEVSDSSANKNGCVETTGVAVIGRQQGATSLEDYDRNRLRRGDLAVLTVTPPGGSSVVHPRGRLYVVSSLYDVETETLEVELGCRLTLLSLTEDANDEQLNQLRVLVPMTLDTAQSTYNNCCAGFASVGQYVFQNNLGNFEVNAFWSGDDYQGTAAGEWLSVLGLTTNSAKPLAGSGAIPDEIRLSYEVPSDTIASDNKGRVDVVESESYYFYQYPVVSYRRQNTDADPDNPNGTLDNVGTVTSVPPPTGGSSSCGNTPPPPTTVIPEPSCNDGYVLVQSPVYLPAYRRSVQTTTYDGPAAQVSSVLTEEYGPAVEANGQYFADEYAYCRQTWGSACNPDGTCPYGGTDEIRLGYTIQTNTYGEANELVSTTTDRYATRLSAAQPSDWRAGNVGGEIQDFDQTLGSQTGMYRASRTIQEYRQENNANIQTTTVFTSIASRQVGISGGQNIDALSGVKTQQVRTSTSITTLDIQPDLINSSTTATSEKDTTIILFADKRYVDNPVEAGPYVREESISQPLLFETEAEIDSAVEAYSRYLERFVKGDAFGLQIGEGLREDVMTNWRPGMPFRYYDPTRQTLMAMRMDACAWGVSQEQTAFVTEGLWNGFSNGTVTLPSNVLGNSAPDMTAPRDGVTGSGIPGTPSGSGGGTPTPPTPPTGGTVDNETNVDSGAFFFTIDVHFSFQARPDTFTVDGVAPFQPGDENVNVDRTITCFVEGVVVGTGDLLSADGNGGLPYEYGGSLVDVDATVIIADLFA